MRNLNFKILLLAFSFVARFSSFSQVTIFQDSFEEDSSAWQNFGLTAPNAWIRGVCSANLGTHSAYITSGGTTNDCSPTGIESNGYVNSFGATQSVVGGRLVFGGCYTSMTVSGSLKMELTGSNDYFEFVYSTDLGISWIPLGLPISSSSSYTTFSRVLPASLDNTNFHLGFRFTYDNAGIGFVAPSIDEFTLQGFTLDNQAPVIVCPGNQTLPSNTNCEISLPDFRPLATPSDNCSYYVLTQSPAIGSTVSVNSMVTISIMDPAGLSSQCSFNVVLSDTTKPSISCPDTVSVYAGLGCSAVVPNFEPLVMVADNCTLSASLLFTQTPFAGSSITISGDLLSTTTDLSGNSKTCKTRLTIIDTMQPVVSCPLPFTVAANNGCEHILENFVGLTSAIDNCSTLFTTSQNPAAGSILNNGTQPISVSYTDQNGNTGQCVFQLTIDELTSPTLVCPASLTLPVDVNCNAQIQNYIPVVFASDNCSSSTSIVLSQSPSPGFNVSSATQVTITGIDDSGNSGQCQITIYPVDVIAPTPACITDTVVSGTSPCSFAIPNLAGTHSAVDNCGSTALLSFSQNPLAGVFVTAPTNVIVTYVDTAGNQGTCETFVYPNDNVFPTITCPGNQLLDNANNCNVALADFASLALVSDNCSAYTISQSPLPGVVIGSGHTPITLTITDVGGNQANCQFDYFVTEYVFPTILCPPSISTCNPLVNYAAIVADDNCNFVLEQTDITGFTDGDIFPIGTTIQSYQVIDSSGNVSACSFDVTVQIYPDTANILENSIFLCDSFETELFHAPIQSGTGTWNLLTNGNTFIPGGLNGIVISNLLIGNNYVEYVVNSPTCGNKRDTVLIRVNTPPNPILLNDTIPTCASTSFLLQGSDPGNGIPSWSSTSGLTFSNPFAPLTTVITPPVGYSEIIYAIDAGACGIERDTFLIVHPAVASIWLNDTTLCLENLPLVLNGNTSYGQSIYWYEINGKATIDPVNENSVTILSAQAGLARIVYRLEHEQCGISRDTIRINFSFCEDIQSKLPTMFTPNSDGQNDVFSFESLKAQFGEIEVIIINRNGSVVYEYDGSNAFWDGKFKNDEVPMGTYFYSIKSGAGGFDDLKGSISLIR